jgi:uncharacterized membrane protein YkvI
MLKAYEPSGNILFEEIQKYPKWIYYMVFGILLFTSIVLTIAGSHSNENVEGLWLGLVIIIVTAVSIVYLMQKIQLEKVVTTNGFYYRWNWVAKEISLYRNRKY